MASGTITPPPGFVLENQPAPNQQEQNQNPAPPPGFVVESQNQNANQSQGDYLSQTEDLISKGEDAVTDVGTGFLKGAGQTLNTISKGVSKVAPSVVRPSDVQGMAQIETPTNTAQQVGVGLEGVAEYFMGDEALKGLSVAEKLGLASRVAKLAESHPAVGKIITAGLNAVRAGAVGTAQGLAHGETAGEALTSGATAAGTGAILEGAGNVVKSLAPKVEKVAGAEIPVRASADSAVADAAESVSRSKPLQQFDVEQTQPGARKAIGNVATDVKNTATKAPGGGSATAAPERVGTSEESDADTQDFLKAKDELGQRVSNLSKPLPISDRAKAAWEVAVRSKKPFKAGAADPLIKNVTGETVVSEQVVARAQELKTARNGLSVASKAADFGDAADQVRAEAKPIYQKLDELTKDQDQTFSDLQRAERSAFNKGDFEAATKAQRAQDKIFEKYKDQFSDPDAYQNARRMWRQASALDKVHDTITSKGVMESTPNSLIPKGVPDPRYIKGKQFTDTILYLRDTGLLKDAGLTPQHVQDLQDIGRLLRKSGEIQSTNQLIKVLKVGTKIAVGGPATAGAGYGASALLGKLMTDEGFAAKAVKALRVGQRVAPGMAANIYREAASALGGSTAQQ